MIRSLRFRLVAASVLALLMVLVLMIGALNIINYSNTVTQADTTLELLAENGGTFPDRDLWEDPRDLQEPPELSPEGEPERSVRPAPVGSMRPGMNGETVPPMPDEADNERLSRGRLGQERRNTAFMSAETRFETRYFTVTLNEECLKTDANVDNIAAIDEDEALAMALEVISGGRQKGFAGNYRYLVSALQAGRQVLFLDCTRSLGTFYNFLYVSIAASLGGWLLVFLLIVLFSGRIIRPVQESYEKQKRFITDAGHELKTPVSIISADADVLESEIGENEWLADIKTQTARLGKLTGELVYLSRMEETPAAKNFTVLDLSELCEEMIPSFRGLAAARNITLETAIGEGIFVKGDPAALGKLTGILMDNAVKYCTPEGSIRASLRRQGKNACLEVENNAEKVDRESLDRMFDRFYRGDPARSGEKAGYGIGLSIAKAVAESHGGRISASSPGEGRLRMTVMLPATGV